MNSNPIALNLKKADPKPPRDPNNYSQEIERKKNQKQHINNKPPLVAAKIK